MTEFVIFGLAIAIVAILWAHPIRGVRRVLASILLAFWLPVLIWAFRDLPPEFNWREALTTPVALLMFAPLIGLWPWYRRRTMVPRKRAL